MGHTQITLTISLIMIALFAVAIIGFSVGFANDNNVAISITDDPDLSAFNINIKNNASQFETDSEGTFKSIIDTTIEPGSDIAQSTGPFAISMTSLVSIGKNIILIPYKSIFGSGSGFGIFFTTFGAIIVFVFGLLLYKTLRGDP